MEERELVEGLAVGVINGMENYQNEMFLCQLKKLQVGRNT